MRVRCRRKKFTFAVSSRDELLVLSVILPTSQGARGGGSGTRHQFPLRVNSTLLVPDWPLVPCSGYNVPADVTYADAAGRTWHHVHVVGLTGCSTVPGCQSVGCTCAVLSVTHSSRRCCLPAWRVLGLRVWSWVAGRHHFKAAPGGARTRRRIDWLSKA